MDRTAWALIPLRTFLGVTFCFAGLQKLANPGFFRASDPASIQAQLAAAARRSPIHALIGPLGHVAVPVGVFIALGELAVGLGTLVGLFSRLAAMGGLVISISLFLTVSFHTSPYYTGSDIVFVFAWLPFVLVAPGPLSADMALTNLVKARQGRRPGRPGPSPAQAAELDRRSFVLKGAVAGALALVGVLGAGLIAGIARLLGGSSPAPAAPALAAGGGSPAPERSPVTTTTTGVPATRPSPRGPVGTGSDTTTTSAPAHPPGTRLGPARAVPVGGAASFRDPGTGDPALVIQPRSGTFLAFDAVCPHAGCTVEFSPSGQVFVCPCHGSQFNARTGAVEVGPAQTGLTPIPIGEGRDGQLYAR